MTVVSIFVANNTGKWTGTPQVKKATLPITWWLYTSSTRPKL